MYNLVSIGTEHMYSTMEEKKYQFKNAFNAICSVFKCTNREEKGKRIILITVQYVAKNQGNLIALVEK